MNDTITRFQPQDIIPVVYLGAPLLFVLLMIALMVWRNVRNAEIASRLKQDMLDRGMTAEEIRIVIAAGESS